MCCSEGHYPKNAGIFRTDIVDGHEHYGGIVSVHGSIWEGDEHAPGCHGAEGDHWHANMPVRLTACIDNNGPVRFSLRAHDWFRHERETSMGLDRDRPSYGGAWQYSLGQGYDFLGTFYCVNQAQRDEVREAVLMALCEGCEISETALRQVVGPFEGVRVRIHRGTTVSRGEVPDLETWRRGNPFVKPPLNDNELLYASDMDDYTMPGHGETSATGLWIPQAGNFEAYELHDVATEWSVESFEELVSEAHGSKGRQQVGRTSPTFAERAYVQAKKRAKNEPRAQKGLF